MRFDFVIPGNINAKTGGYLYDRRLIEGAKTFDVTLIHVQPDNITAPSMIDGLALGHFTKAQVDALKHPFIALIHHPLALEAGLSEAQAQALHISEKYALSRAAHVIVTSPLTAKTLIDDYAVLTKDITVALPGTPDMPRNIGSDGSKFLCIGSLIPRKNYPFLIETLKEIDTDWHLDIVGGDQYAPLETAKIKALVDHRITLHGAKDRLDDFYKNADIFIMPSLYEGYGMVIGEALKAGCPIISTTGGALNDTLPEGAGIKIPVNDIQALKDALLTMKNADTRNLYREKAFLAGQSLPTNLDTARIITDTLKRILT